MRKLVLFALLLILPALTMRPLTQTAAAPHSDLEEKSICLTFDDGPTDSTTPHILDILKSENVKATFFVIGKQVRSREEILRREYEEGHRIAIHTYSHEYKAIYTSEETLRSDILQCRKAILKVLPAWNCDLYRFPGGSWGIRDELKETVKKMKLRAVDWNASAEDAVNPAATADKLFDYVLSSAGNRKHIVLLMHDGVGYKATVQALPKIIQYFRGKGYKFQLL